MAGYAICKTGCSVSINHITIIKLMTTQTTKLYPAIILILLAALVFVFSLLVMDRAETSISGKSNGANGQYTESSDTTVYEWSLVTTWPKNFPGLGSAATNFSRTVKEMSKGRLLVKVHGANELVPALGVFDAVSSGSVQAGHGAAYYWKGKIPSSVFFYLGTLRFERAGNERLAVLRWWPGVVA